MAFEHQRDQPLAIGLSALAGYVDAIGFLWLGGTFISFMSGNSTQLGVELSGGEWIKAAIPLGIVGLFVAGVIAATMLRRGVQRGRPAVLSLVTVLLGLSGLFQATDHTILAITAATLAMGAENAIFEHNGEVNVGLTYMTGTLVKMAQHLTVALLGGPRFGWVPNFLRWLGLMAGAVAGGAAFHRVSLEAIWLAALVAAGLTVMTFIQRVDD